MEAAGLLAVALVAAGCVGVGVKVVYRKSRQSCSSVVDDVVGGLLMTFSFFPPGF